MNGVHDMGGMHGFGPVMPEKNEPVFHEPWEGRALALQRAAPFLGFWNIDQFRDAVEHLPPALYLGASYYEKWWRAVESNLLARGIIGADELQAGRALRPPTQPIARKLSKEDIGRVLRRGSFTRPAQAPARFAPGDKVRTKNIHPVSHTRLPRYARGRAGTVEAVRGCHVFPDSLVLGKGDDPQWVYTIVFDARELWGPGAEASLRVSIEAFEPYLEPA